MTNKELQELLRQFPDDTPVLCADRYGLDAPAPQMWESGHPWGMGPLLVI